MAGFVIDVFLMFFFKRLSQQLGSLKTAEWKRETAVILDQKVEIPGWGCPLVRVFYEVPSGRHFLRFQDEIPFLSSSSANEYARGFCGGQLVTVRVNPENLRDARFFELDQEGASLQLGLK